MDTITLESHPRRIAIDCSPAFQERVQRVLTEPYWGWTERVFSRLILDVLAHVLALEHEVHRVTVCTKLALLDSDGEASAQERVKRISVRITDVQYQLKKAVLTVNYPGSEQRIFRGIIHAFLTAFETVPLENRELFLGYVTMGQVAFTDIPLLATALDTDLP